MTATAYTIDELKGFVTSACMAASREFDVYPDERAQSDREMKAVLEALDELATLRAAMADANN